MKETDNLRKIAAMSEADALKACNSCASGMTYAMAAERERIGEEKPTKKTLSIILRSFFTPFTAVLIAVALIALITGLINSYDNIVDSYDNIISAIIIFVIVLLSGIIQGAQNLKANSSFRRLGQLSRIPVTVKREGILVDIPSGEIVEGDLIVLSAGDRVPADLRLVSGAVSVSQAALTGESRIVKKSPSATADGRPLQELSNLLFYGSTVLSGKGEAVVVNAGKKTLFGEPERKKNPDRKGAGSIVKVLLSFILFLVPATLLVVGLMEQNFPKAVLFALSVAVGIVPEMLPLVVSVCLSKGSRNMMKKKTLVRNVNTMQDFAGVDVLCVDKTGTLTGNEITLEYYLDPFGKESKNALLLSYLNAYFSTGAGNYIDQAILKYKSNPIFNEEISQLTSKYKKLDDLPFGYERKYAAVLLSGGGENKVILKGKIDEVLSKCSYVSCGGEIVPMPENGRRQADEAVGDLLADGMKVLAVAEKISDIDRLTESDICDMVLTGFVVFFDAPKKTAKEAVKKLHGGAVDVVVLTGDDLEVAISVCKRIGIPCAQTVTGELLEGLSDAELNERLKTVKLFAELTPDQKVRIVKGLKGIGHTVGFLGDGINDIPAMCAADVAISVDTAEDAAKEVADVLLLEKDLNVLADGITEGRKICTNVQKYVKITASSNFGNVLALVIASIFASIFFPFQPMVAGQLLLLNILYDLLCFTISFDNVDAEELTRARSWTGKGIGRFAVLFGIASTLFDLITFVFLYYVICPHLVGGSFSTLSENDTGRFIALFRTGWFLESLWTQTLILNILRTRRLPFIESKPSLPFLIVMLVGIVFSTCIPYIPTLNDRLGFAAMPPLYFVYLIGVVLVYVAVILGIKRLYVKKFKELI